MKYKVLIGDDEKNVRIFLLDLLALEGNYDLFEAEDGAEVLSKNRTDKPDLCILDLKLPDKNGIELIPELIKENPGLVIIIITALGTVDNAVSAMKTGAYDFITKPFDVDTILLSVKRAFDYITVRRENTALKNYQKNRIYFEEFIGECREIRGIKNLIPRLVSSDVPILITGETGTGKNVLAKQIHFSLSGPEAPVIYTNCSSIPSSLFESELFGHEKGAFTGADARKKGRAELADGGTLILDEITEIPYEIQAKLLDFLQDKTFYRLGGTNPVSVKVRIIALTNRNLSEEIKAGRFRKDLFYRLNVIHFTIPPLRERGEDLLLLCGYLMELLKKKYNAPKLEISLKAEQMLRSYSWPGNVRELKNVLERAVICLEGEKINEECLTFEEPEEAKAKRFLKDLAEDYEREIIIRRLAEYGGNRTLAAQSLGMSIRNLQYKLEKYDSGE